MPIEYDHDLNQHSLRGPELALPFILADWEVSSLLDVGCGRGTWLKAALDLGVKDVYGVDGVPICPSDLYFPSNHFRVSDLDAELDLGRMFDMALCLEVGEHLDALKAPILVQSLVKHSDCIVFSAAIPGQPGQHHVNGQWPRYWQALFNAHGFTCSDTFRTRIWDNEGIEWWYRQNIFIATRSPLEAGTEPRVASLVHPELFAHILAHPNPSDTLQRIEQGSQPIEWYIRSAFTGILAKLKRQFNV